MEDEKNQTEIEIKTPDGKVLTIVSKPGQDGYTPVKGKDYFDGEKGDKGEPGKDGKDYILTNRDKQEILEKIEMPIVEKIIEKTEVIREQPIVTEIVKEVAIADTGEQIINKINELPLKPENQIDVKRIKNFPNFQNGGSGLNQIFTDGVTIAGSGLADNPLRTISSGGSEWGEITGTLSNQTDLQSALDAKVSETLAIAYAVAL